MPNKRLLLSIIVLLMITNITTLLLWNKSESITLIGGYEKSISNKESVASVNGKKIMFQDWLDSITSTYGKGELETLIDTEVIKQLAKEKKIKVDEKLIERELAVLMTMQGVMTEKEVASWKKKWRENIITRYKLEALLTEDVLISEEEIRTFYETYRNQYDFVSSVQLSHIVVKNDEIAKGIVMELDNGVPFPLLAQEYKEEETTIEAGYIGFFRETSEFLPHDYYDMSMQMKVHSYSEPFKTAEGVAIIYLHQSLPSITFSYEEISPQIHNELALAKLDTSLSAETLREKVVIESVYDE